MSRWWENNVADAGSSLFSDPQLAFDAASVPTDLTLQQNTSSVQAAREDHGAFMNAVGTALGKTDGWLSNIPGWGVTKEVVGYPIDKAATGLRWGYTNLLSRPVATLLLHSAHNMNQGFGGEVSGLFGWGWGKDWDASKKISPGEALMNIENTAVATNGGDLMSAALADNNLSPKQKAIVKQNTDRFIYDTDFWRKKSDWKYNIGSGATDFMFNVLDPAGNAVIGGAADAVKAARSVKMVKVGEGAAQQTVRTRGVVPDLFMKSKTAEEVSASKGMQDAFDWMKQPGRTREEIANHPMWGRGRRANPARYDLAGLIHSTPRELMETTWRAGAGDMDAANELTQKMPMIVQHIGNLSDDRILLEGTKIDPDMLNHFKVNYEAQAGTGAYAGHAPGTMQGPAVPHGLLYEPPTPRPVTPGPRQDGWDKRWGPLAQKSSVHKTIAAGIAEKDPLKIVPATGVRPSVAAAALGEQWKADKLDLINNEWADTVNQADHLGKALGSLDDWTPTNSSLYGTLGNSYRMGGLAFRDTEKAAENATVRSATRGVKSKGSNFVMTAVKKGSNAPLTVIHAFGDGAPQGFVDHTANDARDRVFDMLKQVKGMHADDRLGLIELYNAAGNKIEKSQVLDQIHDKVMDHMLQTNNIHPIVADILKGAIKDGIASKMKELTGKKYTNPAQQFGPETVDAAGNTLRTDRVIAAENGHGMIISPLAQTQLGSNDLLLPVTEINRLIARSSKSFAGFRVGAGNATDWVTDRLDGFDNLWKTATLLRPGFIPRMVSDEWAARAFKFGAMSTLLDGAKGTGNFISNRGRQINAIVTGKNLDLGMVKGKSFGVGDSYVPTTGKGIASKGAFVSLDDQGVINAALARGDKIERIQVPTALDMSYRNIMAEQDAKKATQAELDVARKDPNATQGYLDSLTDRLVDHDESIGEHHDYIGEILRKAEVSRGRRLGDGDFKYQVGGTTYHVPKAFSQQWDNPIPRDQISSHDSYQALYSRRIMRERARFLSHAEKTGAWKIITPDQPDHMGAWVDAVNKQIRQDPFHRMIAGGMNDKDALKWLNTHPEGMRYMKQMGYWNQDKPQFVSNVRFMIDKYLGDNFLKGKLANNEAITEADLRSTFHQDDYPMVHGEEIKENSPLGVRETSSRYIDNLIEAGWKNMADVPSDILSRHPTFLHLHQSEMQKLVGEQHAYKMKYHGTDTITPQEWEKMNQKAAVKAKSDMRQIVYDPRNTTGSQALRFAYPFFKPWADGIQRWGGLVAERPAGLYGMSKIYNAPVAANLVTDADGHHVDEEGYATYQTMDPNTGKMVSKKEFVPLNKRTLHLRAPWAKQNSGNLPISMGSLNTILPGDPWFDPGSGPIIQVAGNQLAKSSPSASEFMQWAKILPYGPSDNTSDILTPKYMMDVYNAYLGKDTQNTAYQQAYLDAHNLAQAKYNEDLAAHKQGVKEPSHAKIANDAKKFLWLRALVDWTSPVATKTSPLTGTKYQFFVDQYKQLEAADPATARSRFTAMHGEQYLGFTESLTKSMGIAASMSADRQMEKYRDLIADDPDMAPLLIGNIYNGGPFSKAIQVKQLHDEIGGVPVRQAITAEQAINQERVQQGWDAYMQANKALNAQLIRSGFRSYTQTGAEQFQQYKRNITANLSAQNPAWFKAFGTTDRNAIPGRIATMQKMVMDPTIMNDPLRTDAHTLAVYLAERQQFKGLLAQRGLSQLSYDQAGTPIGPSADIGYAWNEVQMGLVNSSVQFDSLFNRYLTNDQLQ